jgi:hypothetical protein
MNLNLAFFAWLSSLFAPPRTVTAADQYELLDRMSVADLCDARREIERALHNRALKRQPSIPYATHAAAAPFSVTLLSVDRSTILVRFGEPSGRFGMNAMGTGLEQFPDDPSSDSALRHRWFGVGHRIPVDVYESGADAIAAMYAAEELERQAGYEQHEREQYEKLKAKFG